MIIKVKKINKEARLPQFSHSDDVGMDFFSVENYKLSPGRKHIYSTGIALEIPNNYAGLIWEKSSLGMKKSIIVLGGVIDSGYRGEIKVALLNSSKKDYRIRKGDKIANLLIQKIYHPKILESNKLSRTKRGMGAMGSTGKK